MSAAIFPKLRGLSWPKTETPVYSTRVTKHVSGRETRVQLYKYPLYEFEITHNGLSDARQSPLGAGSLQTLYGFWLARGGSFDTFYVRKSDFTGNSCDSRAEGQQIGVGDGVTTTFTCVRQVTPAYIEPVGIVEPQGANAYVNGKLVSFTCKWPNQIVYSVAPALGTVLTADYTFYFNCRFQDDTTDWENFAATYWRNKSLKLVTVKIP